MGFLKILKKVKQKERELRILILGLDNAGYGFLCKLLIPVAGICLTITFL